MYQNLSVMTLEQSLLGYNMIINQLKRKNQNIEPITDTQNSSYNCATHLNPINWLHKLQSTRNILNARKYDAMDTAELWRYPKKHTSSILIKYDRAHCVII